MVKGFQSFVNEYYGRGLNQKKYMNVIVQDLMLGAGGETLSKFNLKIAFLQDDKEVSGVTI